MDTGQIHVICRYRVEFIGFFLLSEAVDGSTWTWSLHFGVTEDIKDQTKESCTFPAQKVA